MNSSRILVTGFPAGTTTTQLMIYFQSERESGGGDVESIEIDRGVAQLTFEDVEGIVILVKICQSDVRCSSVRYIICVFYFVSD